MTHFTSRTIRTSRTTRPCALMLALATGSSLAFAFGASTASAKPSFDGLWTVAVVTKSGPCNGGYNYPVRITEGALGDGGQGLINVSGRVGGNGEVSVTMSHGVMRARGAGHLSGTTGSGSWRAPGCIGSWTAHKQ